MPEWKVGRKTCKKPEIIIDHVLQYTLLRYYYIEHVYIEI